jgi:hypothetical protein
MLAPTPAGPVFGAISVITGGIAGTRNVEEGHLANAALDFAGAAGGFVGVARDIRSLYYSGRAARALDDLRVGVGQRVQTWARFKSQAIHEGEVGLTADVGAADLAGASYLLELLRGKKPECP